MPFNMNAGYGRMIAQSLANRRPHTGKVFFVIGSSQANWEELTEMFPPGPEGKTRVFTDLQAALDQTADGGDDVIFVAPGYTENITAAADIDINNSQVTIIGLGEGTQRPTFTFTTAVGADLNLDGAGCVLENLVFDLTGVDALTGPIDVNAAGCVIRKCKFITASSTNQAVVAIVTDANADDLLIEDCYLYGSENAGSTSAIRLVGGDNIVIQRNHIEGNFKTTAGGIEATTTAPGALLIRDNVIVNRTASATRAINLVANTNASIVNNRLHIRLNTSPISVNETGTTVMAGHILIAGNYYNNVTGVSAGILL